MIVKEQCIACLPNNLRCQRRVEPNSEFCFDHQEFDSTINYDLISDFNNNFNISNQSNNESNNQSNQQFRQYSFEQFNRDLEFKENTYEESKQRNNLTTLIEMIITQIKNHNDENVILSESDVINFILYCENKELIEQIPDTLINSIIDFLIEDNMIYHDKESYIENVRNKGKISFMEHLYKIVIEKEPNITHSFTNNLFLVDENGNFII